MNIFYLSLLFQSVLSNCCLNCASTIQDTNNSTRSNCSICLSPYNLYKFSCVQNCGHGYTSISSTCAEDELSDQEIPRNLAGELEMTDLLNKKAIEVLDRVMEKLTGNDFIDCKELSVHEQVDRLIKEARSVKNLSQSYIGWCPFW